MSPLLPRRATFTATATPPPLPHITTIAATATPPPLSHSTTIAATTASSKCHRTPKKCHCTRLLPPHSAIQPPLTSKLPYDIAAQQSITPLLATVDHTAVGYCSRFLITFLRQYWLNQSLNSLINFEEA